MIRFVQASLILGTESVLSGVSGEVGRKLTVALIGPSGAGKSSLLSLCNLLHTPSAGEVYIADKEVRKWDVRELRRKVGMVFQTPTIFEGTVRDNLAYGLRLHGEELKDGERLLGDVGLDRSLMSKSAEDLSGGQKQRVALGRTLAMEPEVLLLDEVTSALDIHAKREVEDTILSLRSKIGGTLLWVTHDLEQAKRVADEIWFMDGGRLLETSSVTQFFLSPLSAEARRFVERREGDAST